MHSGGGALMIELIERRKNRHGKVSRGRPPKANAIRDSKGKARGEADVMETVLNQPHRRCWPIERKPNGDITDLRKDAKAETHHGRYALSKEITEPMYKAGDNYRKAHVKYTAALAVPDSLRRSSGGSGVTPDATAKRNVEKFTDAFNCLDKRAAQTIAHVLFRDQPVPFGEWVHYRRGLIRLAQHYGMGE